MGEFVKDPDREKVFSSVMIRELIARTNKQLTKLDANEIIGVVYESHKYQELEKEYLKVKEKGE